MGAKPGTRPLKLGGVAVVKPDTRPLKLGGVAEWSKAAVLKTVDSSRGPWVRILPPPQTGLEIVPKEQVAGSKAKPSHLLKNGRGG